MTSVDERTVPADLAVEEALIGAMLLSRDACAAAVEAELSPADFYRPAHQLVFGAIAELYAAGEAVDPRTVHDVLVRQGVATEADSPNLLGTALANTPSTSSAGRYARIIGEHALLRRLIGAGGQITEIGYSLPTDVGGAVEQAERLLSDLADARRSTTSVVRLGDTMPEYLDLLEARFEGTVPTGVLTGWHDLDEMLGGLWAGQLIVVCARPSMGKSAVGAQLVLNAARTGVPTLLASVEMGLVELQDRFAASHTQIPHDHLRKGRLSDRDWQRVVAVNDEAFRALPLYLLDDPSATVGAVRSAARRVPGLGLVVVDYLQLLETAKAENRQVEVATISRGLRLMARQMDVPVVALAQLNRGVEQRAEKRPTLGDLRESGQLEQDAHVVLGLYRDEYYHPASPDRGVLEVGVLKQRSGPTGVVRLHFDVATQRIANMVQGAGL